MGYTKGKPGKNRAMNSTSKAVRKCVHRYNIVAFPALYSKNG